MKILITGITGRIGANLAKFFINKGHKVTGFVWPDDRQLQKTGLLGAEIIEGDLAEFNDVFSAFKHQEVILHLGAAFQAGGPFDAKQYFDTNVKGTFNVLQASKELKRHIKHLIITSSDATISKYPSIGIQKPISEYSLPQDITDWYGYSKILSENLSNRFFVSDKLPVTIIRFAMVWGAGEVLKFNQFYTNHFINGFSKKIDFPSKEIITKLKNFINEGKELIIACDQNGRPWKKHVIDIRDIIQAFEKIIGVEKSYGETYQIAGRTPFTWDDVIPYLSAKINKDYCRMNLPINPTFYEFNITKSMKDYNFLPKWDIKMMIDDAVEFMETKKGDIIPTVLEEN